MCHTKPTQSMTGQRSVLPTYEMFPAGSSISGDHVVSKPSLIRKLTDNIRHRSAKKRSTHPEGQVLERSPANWKIGKLMGRGRTILGISPFGLTSTRDRVHTRAWKDVLISWDTKKLDLYIGMLFGI